MIQMLPLRDADELARHNAAAGTSAAFAYCLYGTGDGDGPDGWILYDLDFSLRELVIRALNAPALPYADGLIRAVFASVFDRGILSARLAPELAEEPFVRLGFTQPGGRRVPSLEQALTHCGCCQGRAHGDAKNAQR